MIVRGRVRAFTPRLILAFGRPLCSAIANVINHNNNNGKQFNYIQVFLFLCPPFCTYCCSSKPEIAVAFLILIRHRSPPAYCSTMRVAVKAAVASSSMLRFSSDFCWGERCWHLRLNTDDIEMTWLSGFYTYVLLWSQSHPFVATFCVLVFLYNLNAWLDPDPIMDLPSPRGGRWFGGHVFTVIE